MFQCLVSAKFSMSATVLTQGATAPGPDTDPTGSWSDRQNPDTGDIERVWTPTDSDLSTPEIEPKRIRCMVRGIISNGIRVAGTTERYTPQGLYDNIDFVRMSFPAHDTITKRDRVTDIKNSRGEVIWKEEEFDSRGTVFDVTGVTPILDPFGNHVENLALLQRAEVQQYG